MQLYYFLYLVLSVFPIWFISYSIKRFKRHWNDGKDKYIVLNKHVYTKWFLSFLMTTLTTFHIIDLALFTDIPLADLVSRSCFFSLLLIAWLLSFALGIFENNKRLMTAWTGHRSFWPSNVLIHIILMIGDGFYLADIFYISDWAFILEIIYIFEIICCLILSYYAVRRPNEFILVGQLDYAFLRRSSRRTLNFAANLDAEAPKISIKSYKIKQEEGKSITLFTITSVFKALIYVSKRTLQEFDALNKYIIDSFPQSDYPNLAIPVISLIPSQEIDEKMTILSDYLNSLCLPQFYSEVFLNFLSIDGAHQAHLLKLNEDIMKNEANLEAPQFRSSSIAQKYFNPSLINEDPHDEEAEHYTSISTDIKIPRWEEVGDHIEFEIIWEISKFKQNGSVFKRYNEILDFHKTLLKLVSPAKLPDFPKKNYLKKLNKIDKKALDTRKRKLEQYLNHVFNDVAFLSTQSLEFLGIKESVERVWNSFQVNYEIRVGLPFVCSPVIDDDGHYLNYDIRCSKIVEKTRFHEWTVSKRYRQFDSLHHFLTKRLLSPVLAKYNEVYGIKSFAIPALPSKSVSPLLSLAEIEARRVGLEKYVDELLIYPGILQAYCFREFVRDPILDDNYKIN